MNEQKSCGLYPLKFAPIYQHRIWGGDMMTSRLGRQVPSDLKPVGESWELSDRDDAASVIINGELAGQSFRDVYSRFREEILGPRGRSAGRFPLLVKLIDAGECLSLQVHPDENACREIGGGAEPKTEMWYILAATEEGKIMAGLSSRATRHQVSGMLEKPEVEELLQVNKSQERDAYFIPSGTLHAIGGGNLILEIQQNSDTTYRVSDWGRVDASGKSRELHVEKGMKSINFTARTNCRISAVSDHSDFNRKFDVVNQCPFFRVSELHLRSTWFDDTNPGGSFHLISAVNAPVTVGRRDDAASAVALAPGETLLVPYCCGAYSINVCGGANETVVVKTTL